MNPLIQRETTILPLLIPPLLLLTCFALLPMAQAVGPDTDGAIPGANHGEGIGVLVSRTEGVWNTGVGFQALNQDTVGGLNTATGIRALFSNTGGNNNTATGVYALYANVEGSFNNAVGAFALGSNTLGNDNTAHGTFALLRNIEGSWNTAVGSQALTANTGYSNSAIGFEALSSNTDGSLNTAVGSQALLLNNIGGRNTALGYGALSSSTSGTSNTALGWYAGWTVTDASNVICIGSIGENISNSTWIGSVYGITPKSGTTAPVVVSDEGQLGTVASSERFKKDIAMMDKASDAILLLRPVTFHYRSDAKETPQFGLIAEDVARVNPALVLPDKEGKPYTVRYDAVNAMLLNEFLKEHRKVEKLEAALRAVNERLAEQDSKIQKVSAELQLSRQAPQTVSNER